MEMQLTRQEIAKYIEAGDLTEKVSNSLLSNNEFVPAEGCLFDYKRDVPTDRLSLLKTLKHIAAFHNTYGGYLIFGADEAVKDQPARPIHKTINQLDSKQVRDLVREYLGVPIEIQCAIISLNLSNEQFQIILLHIPKRSAHEPVAFSKNATEGKIKIFEAEQVFIRDGDNSIACSKPAHWKLIYGERQNPYLSSGLIPMATPLHSNLPDRSFIYQSFVGRQDTLSSLWKWLGDDFSCVKVLAGEGGLGKTSIAYEFAQEVCKAKPCNFLQVVWLTAKKEQFRAMYNYYEALPATHYDSASALFRQILEQLGMFEHETLEISDPALPKQMRDIVQRVQSFIVIDDLDSLSPDNQRRAIEVCQQMANTGTKFLFTTRKNVTASSSSAIELQGFEINDFRIFVDGWTDRLKLDKFTETQIKKVIKTTQGSPLYTESFLRLLKQGIKFSEALNSWEGKLGSDVRKAALEREVKQLTLEARKVIVAVAVRGSASNAELKQVTGYTDQTLFDCLNELQSLFLLSAPQIANQMRFTIPQTTQALVLSLGTDLISDFELFTKSIREAQYKSSKKTRKNEPSVGSAINQAMALLRQENIEDALRTVDEVNKLFHGKNADLLFMRGRILAQASSINWGEVRRTYRSAYDNGQQKELFFVCWYESEIHDNHYEGAIEVCNNAMVGESAGKGIWLQRSANARFKLSERHEQTGDREHGILQLNCAIDDLLKARQYSSENIIKSTEILQLELVHDKLWKLFVRHAKEATTWVQAIDTQISAVQRGDERIEVYERVVFAFYQLSLLFFRPVDGPTNRQYALLNYNQLRIRALLNSAKKVARGSNHFTNVVKTFEEINRENLLLQENNNIEQ